LVMTWELRLASNEFPQWSGARASAAGRDPDRVLSLKQDEEKEEGFAQTTFPS